MDNNQKKKFDTAFATIQRNKDREKEDSHNLEKKASKSFDFHGKSSFKGFKYKTAKPFSYEQVTKQKRRLGLQ